MGGLHGAGGPGTHPERASPLPAAPSGGRRSRRRSSPQRTQALMAPSASADGRPLPVARSYGARPRPRHRVRRSRVPEHLRVLVGGDGDLHGQRVTLHPGVRFLPGRHPPPFAPRPLRARKGGRGGRSDGAGPRGGDLRGSRRPVRRRCVGHRGDRRGHSRSTSWHHRRGADLRLQGRPQRARCHLRRTARRAQPQPRDRAPAATSSPALGDLRAESRACWPVPPTAVSSSSLG